jgi:flagellum-specific ATP synthase
LKRANRFRRLWTLYQQNKDLIQIGAYEQGSNPEIDEAIQKRAALEAFMIQSSGERFTVQQTEKLLSGIV